MDRNNFEETINTPWLIQRISFKSNKVENPSFDELLSLDYMGSAEFEFGALPKSLKILCRNCDDLNIFKEESIKRVDGEPLYMICMNQDRNTYFPYIQKMIKGEIHLKESHQMEAALTGKKYSWRDDKVKDLNKDIPSSWWDIENHVLWTFGKKNAIKILKAIRRTRNKKREDKQEGWY